jgi:polyferredoxin
MCPTAPDAAPLVQLGSTPAPKAGSAHVPAGAPARRKKLGRRAPLDRSQRLRRAFQLSFVALNLWMGVQFYLWVRHFETGGASRFVTRPPGVEGWLPIASLMNLKATLLTGELPRVHPAGMFLLAAFVAISLLFRKAFCSWLCPVGTLSEYLWRLGRKLFRRNLALPRWADLPLRSLKYVLFGLFAWVVVIMPVPGIRAFLEGPYGLVADVKMLDFFRRMTTATAVGVAALVVLSLVVKNFWCRYLCPYGALLGLVGLASPARIRRDAELCIDCAKCAKACPAGLPVDVKPSIRSAECAACLECVASCPAEGALMLAAPGRRRIPPWALAAGIAAVFLGVVAAARLTGHWETELPTELLFQLVPRASELSHP